MTRLLFFVAMFLIVGCKSTFEPAVTEVWREGANDRVGVIVALTKVNPASYGGWDGACPGTDVDSQIIAKELTKRGIPYQYLFNSRATAHNVIVTVTNAARSLKKDGLLFLYFSGHGGQLSGGQNETDKKDETLCLWDGQMRDDVVWSFLTKLDPAKNIKVFMVTDCCNSGSNYRAPRNYANTLNSRVFTSRGTPRYVVPNLLHWGGCGDGESSYGSSRGGAFTLAWKKALDKGLTYSQTQTFVSGQLTTQRPTFATLGQFDLSKKVFEK